ncbi:hypothetical protein [Alloprevotella tannerae]|uniref:hypothetical protein n=1 Tax=Alloprevotella tannerae TaxID=76122 RepID=UPI0028E78E7C|nr:hypothetical protein [Alloprevotella tannerae]
MRELFAAGGADGPVFGNEMGCFEGMLFGCCGRNGLRRFEKMKSIDVSDGPINMVSFYPL